MPQPVRLADLHLDDRLKAAAKRHWHYRLQALGRDHDGDFYRVRIAPRGRQHTRVCLAAGIHGDEPAGIEALVRLIETGEFPHGVAVDCFPCMNPEGAASGRREDDHGTDLNREFGELAPPETIAAFEAATNGVAYDLYVDLHEDDRARGFYMFESQDAEAMAPAVTEAVNSRGFELEPPDELKTLIDEDGFERFGTFEVAPGVASTQMTAPLESGLPAAVYMRACQGAHIMTLETPASLAFDRRVEMHLTAMRAIFAKLKRRSHVAALNPQREWLASEPSHRPRR
jgi:hypothetical protein